MLVDTLDRLGISSLSAEGDEEVREEIKPSILEAIGATPLIRLNQVAREVPAQILVKLEALNPGGSIKDRVGVAMVDEAERQGWLGPGGTIVEATAGNTGVGLALAAAVKGYRCIFVLPDKMSAEKIRLLKAYGAEIVITPTSVPPDSAESYNGVADRLTREIKGAWRPNQFSNLSNPDVHYRTTGPEIWEQSGGRISALVAGVGTGGTISGAGLYLKEQDPAIKVVGADPEGSVLSGDSPKPWKVEGIGEDFVPSTFNGQVVDLWIRVSDEDSFRVARDLARREGILVGGSSGTAVAAALKYAQRLTPTDVVIVICPDTGRNYLSKFFDDDWMLENKFASTLPAVRTVGDLIRMRGSRPLCVVGIDVSAAEAVERMQSLGISQLPVVHEGSAVGSIQEVTIARLLHDGLDPETVRVGDVMARPLPQLDVGVNLDEAYRLLLSGSAGVLATAQGAVIDIITRIDLIAYWKRARAG